MKDQVRNGQVGKASKLTGASNSVGRRTWRKIWRCRSEAFFSNADRGVV